MFTHSASWAILQAKCMERSCGILNTPSQFFVAISSFCWSRVPASLVFQLVELLFSLWPRLYGGNVWWGFGFKLVWREYPTDVHCSTHSVHMYSTPTWAPFLHF